MINLIPPKGHKSVKLEYVLRVSATLGFLFAGVLVLLSVAMIPTYVLVDAQIEAFKTEKAQLEQSDETLFLADQEVTLTKEILAQMKRAPKHLFASNVIDEVRQAAPPSIRFTSFIIDTEAGAIDDIKITGQAPTREQLAALKSALEATDMFDTAQVPIADLARDENLPFAITVTLTKE